MLIGYLYRLLIEVSEWSMYVVTTVDNAVDCSICARVGTRSGGWSSIPGPVPERRGFIPVRPMVIPTMAVLLKGMMCSLAAPCQPLHVGFQLSHPQIGPFGSEYRGQNVLKCVLIVIYYGYA